MIVRARSPYIIFINEVGQTSGKLELRIWKNGETKPTLPTYSFTKSIPSPTQTLLRFNISPYLKDFISNLLYDVNTWYCKFECRLFSNNVELPLQKIDGINVEVNLLIDAWTNDDGRYDRDRYYVAMIIYELVPNALEFDTWRERAKLE